MNYSPKDYHDRISQYEAIVSQADTISGIDIPDSENEEVDMRPVQKELRIASQDLTSMASTLIDMVWGELDNDLNEKVAVYVENVNNDLEVEAFPFIDWATCAKFKDKNKNWKVGSNVLREANDFDKNTPEKIMLSLENTSAYLHMIIQTNWNDIGAELKNLKTKYSKLSSEYNTYFDHLFFSISEYEYIYSLNENVSNVKVGNHWTDFASVELITNWGTPYGEELWSKFVNYMKNELNDKKIENVKKIFLEKCFFNFFLNRNGFFTTNTNITFKDLNWNQIQEFVVRNKEDKTNLNEMLFTMLLPKIKSSQYSLTNYQAELINYDNLLKFSESYDLSKKLNKELENKDTTINKKLKV